MDVATEALSSILLLEDTLDQEIERREEELAWNRRKLVYLEALGCADSHLNDLELDIRRSEGVVKTLKQLLQRTFEERSICSEKVQLHLQLKGISRPGVDNSQPYHLVSSLTRIPTASTASQSLSNIQTEQENIDFSEGLPFTSFRHLESEHNSKRNTTTRSTLKTPSHVSNTDLSVSKTDALPKKLYTPISSFKSSQVCCSAFALQKNLRKHRDLPKSFHQHIRLSLRRHWRYTGNPARFARRKLHYRKHKRPHVLPKLDYSISVTHRRQAYVSSNITRLHHAQTKVSANPATGGGDGQERYGLVHGSECHLQPQGGCTQQKTQGTHVHKDQIQTLVCPCETATLTSPRHRRPGSRVSRSTPESSTSGLDLSRPDGHLLSERVIDGRPGEVAMTTAARQGCCVGVWEAESGLSEFPIRE